MKTAIGAGVFLGSFGGSTWAKTVRRRLPDWITVAAAIAAPARSSAPALSATTFALRLPTYLPARAARLPFFAFEPFFLAFGHLAWSTGLVS
jgi:hypothetical protein